MKSLLKTIGLSSFNYGGRKCRLLAEELLVDREVGRFLDVGCGDGRTTLEFAALAGAREIHGIEYVEQLRLQAASAGVNCVKADLNEPWPFDDGFFDLILSSQNIEHIHNTRLYVEECHRCLKPGGQVLITTENLASWVNVFALLFGWQPFSTTGISGWVVGVPKVLQIHEPSELPGYLSERYDPLVSGTTSHVRVLAYSGVKDLLVKSGFREVRVLSCGYPPLWGRAADFMCQIDRRHGHFLVASCLKERS